MLLAGIVSLWQHVSIVKHGELKGDVMQNGEELSLDKEDEIVLAAIWAKLRKERSQTTGKKKAEEPVPSVQTTFPTEGQQKE